MLFGKNGKIDYTSNTVVSVFHSTLQGMLFFVNIRRLWFELVYLAQILRKIHVKLDEVVVSFLTKQLHQYLLAAFV